MTDEQFSALLESTPKNQNIDKYLKVTRNKLSTYCRIAVSYSGGSDSDTMLDLIELVKPEDCGEIKYVFFDTGLEWDATLRHVAEMEERYGITIERLKAKKTIPAACKEYGIPFIAKEPSHYLGILQAHGFDWNDRQENATAKKYGKCQSVLDWWFCAPRISRNGKKRKDITQFKHLREFMQQHPPNFAISKKCCDYAKKNVSHEFNREFRPDICIGGMRLSEGGLRTASIKNCFSLPRDDVYYAEYRPLWFWTDEDKRIYKEWRGLQYSDCYENWGFKRTGCVGCPCAAASVEQLRIAEQYEPNKVKAAYAVFGKSYEYREKYNEFKKRAREVGTEQISLFDAPHKTEG